MKKLTLLRHAKSTWDDPVARDFDRPLNPRGRRAARTIGQEMRAQGLAFDQVIASPAVRVVETLDDVSAGYGAAIEPRYDERVYLASAEILIELIHQTQDSADSLLIVGHNPGLERLVLKLTRDNGEAMRADVAVKYPTATLAEIDFAVDRWADVAEATGTLARFIRPRDLDPELGPDEDSY
jgi:phosphohistidine phosphatase